jgi:5-bromo-4-chloroindolyl phosphate hydrolysis protein
MATYIPSTVSAEEFFKHYCTDENAVAFYEQAVAGQAKMAKELASADRAVEILEEQASFARALIEELEAKLERAKSLKDFRKEWKMSLDNSYFEL